MWMMSNVKKKEIEKLIKQSSTPARHRQSKRRTPKVLVANRTKFDRGEGTPKGETGEEKLKDITMAEGTQPVATGIAERMMKSMEVNDNEDEVETAEDINKVMPNKLQRI